MAQEQVLGGGGSVEWQEGDLAPSFDAGERHVLLHLVDQLLSVFEGTLEVGERMLRVGQVPGLVIPRGDEVLGLELPVRALGFEEPDNSLAPDTVADNANERLFGEGDAHRSQRSREAGIAGGAGG